MTNFIENFTLIKNRNSSHVSHVTTSEFENEIINYFTPKQAIEKTGFLFKVYKHLVNKYPSLQSWKKTDDVYFSVLMGHQAIKSKVPFLLLNSTKKVVYLFDAWQSYEKEIIQLVHKFGLHIIFFSSEDACNYYRDKMPQVACHWVAEGITSKPFQERSSTKKDMDILQLGRNYSKFNDIIIQFCKDQQKTYLYEKEPGQLIFGPQSDALHTGLARTKVSICVPQSVAHPEKTGLFSTMTRRYLESMASKCLIIGVLPNDMKHLFSYNPIIEVNSDNLTEHLEMVFQNFDKFQPLIEKNYTEVIKNHQWRNRCEQIAKTLKNQ